MNLFPFHVLPNILHTLFWERVPLSQGPWYLYSSRNCFVQKFSHLVLRLRSQNSHKRGKKPVIEHAVSVWEVEKCRSFFLNFGFAELDDIHGRCRWWTTLSMVWLARCRFSSQVSCKKDHSHSLSRDFYLVFVPLLFLDPFPALISWTIAHCLEDFEMVY